MVRSGVAAFALLCVAAECSAAVAQDGNLAQEAQNPPLLFRNVVLGQHRSEVAHHSFPRFKKRDRKSLASAAQQSWVVLILIHDMCVEAIAVSRQHAF